MSTTPPGNPLPGSAPRILAFAGSLRRESWNKKLVKLAMEGARAAGAEVTYLDLKDLPLPGYDEDLEQSEGLPENAARFRELLLQHQGLLISTPEYNSSIPGAFKNAIDWATRTAHKKGSTDAFHGKVVGLMSASPGAFGAARSLVTVRSILTHIGGLVIPETISLPLAHEAFGPDGKLKDPKRQASVEKIGARLAQVVAALAPR
jgi:NAD(P)H-dependent FMN reductase